jgi:hypothetical protein
MTQKGTFRLRLHTRLRRSAAEVKIGIALDKRERA